MTLRFPSELRPTRILTPEGWVRQVSELRRDPLTGRSGRVAHFAGFQLVAPRFEAEVAASRPNCPFCPERLERVTPRLPPRLFAEGRLRRGEATLFPNLSPYDRHSVVISLTREHMVELDGFSQRQLADGLRVAIDYFRALAPGPRGSHSLLTWNYMPPAGATQVHPHLQAFLTDRPGWLLEEEVRRSRAFLRRRGTPYWLELVECERGLGSRFIAQGERTTWLTAYVSRSVVSDVLVVFPRAARLEDLDQETIEEWCVGLRVALGALHAEGIRAFNLGFFGAPDREKGGDHWRLHARLCPRIYFNPLLRGSDSTSWQHLLDEPFMVRSPESLAAGLRPHFRGRLPPPSQS